MVFLTSPHTVTEIKHTSLDEKLALIVWKILNLFVFVVCKRCSGVHQTYHVLPAVAWATFLEILIQ